VFEDLVVPKETPLTVSFSDSDPLAGMLGGMVQVTRVPSSDADRYYIYFGLNSTHKIAGSTPIATINGSNSGATPLAAPLWWGYMPSTSIPTNAAYVVAMSGYGENVMGYGIGVAIFDFVPPTAVAEGLAFEDVDSAPGRIAGTVSITKASNETGLLRYNVYLATSDNQTRGFLGSVLPNSSTSNVLEMTVTNTRTFNASKLVVFAVNANSEAIQGRFVDLVDFSLAGIPAQIKFKDTDTASGSVGGSVTLTRAIEEDGILSYSIYWATASGVDFTRTAFATGIVLQSNISSHIVFEMIDSWGDGWNGAYYNIRDSAGNSLYSDTLSSGHRENHTLSIAPGADYTVDVSSGGWPAEISWNLWHQNGALLASGEKDVNAIRDGVPFTVTGERGRVMWTPRTISVNVPAGTVMPAGTSHVLAYSVTSDGESEHYTVDPVFDFAPPTYSPSSLEFNDTDVMVSRAAGAITIGRASNETGIDTYNVYWGRGSQKIPLQRTLGLVAEFYDFNYQVNAIPDFAFLEPTSRSIHADVVYNNPGDWGTNFAWRWTGFIRIQRAGTYVFEIGSDDGSQLFLDGTRLIDNGGLHGLTWVTASKHLEPGDYPLRLEYFQRYGGKSMILKYEGPDTSSNRINVPGRVLFHGGADVSLITKAPTNASSSGVVVVNVQLDGTDAAIPAGTTHLVAFSASNTGGESTSGVSIPLVDLIIPQHLATNASFQDVDTAYQQISGWLNLKRAASELDMTHYVVYWGLAAASKISSSPQLATLYVNVGENGSWADTWINAVAPPTNATHLVIYSAQGSSESTTGFGIPFRDYAPPNVNASALEFLDTNTSRTFLGGTVTVSAASDESSLTGYRIRFGTQSGVSTEYPAWGDITISSGAALTLDVSGIALPRGQTHLVVTSVGAMDEALAGVSIPLVDVVQPQSIAVDATFEDTDDAENVVQGEVSITKAPDESDISHYHVYWGTSTTEKLPETNARRLLQGRRLTAPVCTGNACDQITISSQTANEWIISRGNSGYENHETASITLNGAGTLSFTQLSTETCCDHVEIAGDRYSGTNLPADIELAPGMNTVLWSSDYSVSRNGWSMTFTRSSGGGGVEYDLPTDSLAYIGSVAPVAGMNVRTVAVPAATAIPTSAEYFLIFSAYGQWEAPVPFALEIVDFHPPTQVAAAVAFADTDMSLRQIAGQIVITPAVDETLLTEYRVYWGQSATQKVETSLPGLRAEFFEFTQGNRVPSFEGHEPVLERVDATVNFEGDRGDSGWYAPVRKNNFAVRWTGSIEILQAGQYQFYIRSDDGSNLYMDGEQLIDNDGTHGMRTASGSRTLAEGSHTIRLEFFERNGNAGMIFKYRGPDTSPATEAIVVPASRLFHSQSAASMLGSVPVAQGQEVSLELATGTHILQGATHLLVFCASGGGESDIAASVLVYDSATPTQQAAGLEFTDVAPGMNEILGNVTVYRASSEVDITHYNIYWGVNNTQIDGLAAVASIEARGSGGATTTCGRKGNDNTPLRHRHRSSPGTKIVNGQDATECEWKWQVSLRQNGWHFCGGTIISPRWVLSAAHCVSSGSTNFQVVAGDHNKESSGGYEVVATVARVIPHADYDSDTMANDFALIELEEELELGDCIGVACLPELGEAVDDGARCVISGWGTLSSGGDLPDILQEAEVSTLSNSECGSRYGADSITDSMVCAQGSSSGGVVDSCQGDSGGPLVCDREDGSYVIHGATSWGYGCAQAQYPGIYARVSQVLPWIYESTGIQSGGGGGGGGGGNSFTHPIAESAQAVPSGATHLMVFTSYNGNDMQSGRSVRIVDFAPPIRVPESIAFIDTDATQGEVSGVITVARATNEDGESGSSSAVASYRVYWASVASDGVVVKHEMIGEVQTSGTTASDLTLTLRANTELPDSATHLIAFAASSMGEAVTGSYVTLDDLDQSYLAGGVEFSDVNEGLGVVSGVVTIQRALNEGDISAYVLYWGTSATDCTKHSTDPLGQVGLGGAGSSSEPTCRGNSCGRINILSSELRTWSISRGSSGYRNNEKARIFLSGPGMVSFQKLATESTYDYLDMWGAQYSGEDIPADIPVPEGEHIVTWSSDYSIKIDGWAFTFQKSSVLENYEFPLPSQELPSNAQRLLVFSWDSDSVEQPGCATLTVEDYAPPTEISQGIEFEDTDAAPGILGGTVTVMQAANTQGILAYNIWWGSNETHRLPESSTAPAPLFIMTVGDTRGSLTADLPSGKAIPEGATHLLAFSVGEHGTSAAARSFLIEDHSPPVNAAAGISFTDEDPAEGVVGGAAIVLSSSVTTGVSHYNVYWASSTGVKLALAGTGELGSVSAPVCSGPSCSSIRTNPLSDGAWEITRGTNGYEDDESATVEITGPSQLTFTFFSTEANYDIVELLGVDYSGEALPDPQEIPPGTHELKWRSDFSIQRSGWTFVLTPLNREISIPIPGGTMPNFSSQLLVLSAGTGGEMTVGPSTNVTDFSPPTVVARGLRFEDTNMGIGELGGTFIIYRTACDYEVGRVRRYSVYWATATGRIQGLAPVAELTLAVATCTDSEPPALMMNISAVTLQQGATHFVVHAAGDNGEAVEGASVVVVDAHSLTFSPPEITVVSSAGANASLVDIVIANSQDTADLTLNLELVFQQDEAAQSGSGSSGSSSRSSGGRAATTGTCPSNMHRQHPKGEPVMKNRLLFKWKPHLTLDGRRLGERRLSSQYPVNKIHNYRKLHLAYVDLNGSADLGRVLEQMQRDPDIEFVEEDQTVYALASNAGGSPLFASSKRSGAIFPQSFHSLPKVSGRSARSTVGVQSTLVPDDPSMSDLWGMDQANDNDIDAPEAWALHTGLNRRVIVAVIDTGVDYNHEDLRDQMWTNTGEIPDDGIDNDGNGFIDDVHGYDFQNDDGDPWDDQGHGTHCAGTIGAAANNGVGVAGVSWGAQIMALKFLGANGGSISSAIQAVDYAVQMGAHLTSNSWGGGGFSAALEAAIQEAHASGQLFIAAAGNDGRNNDNTATFPCNYDVPNMICVASTTSEDDLSGFSNYGTDTVHLGAPGSNIYSTYPNNRYRSLSGTSMATPHVAGAAALVWDFAPRLMHTELKEILLSTGDAIAKLAGKVETGKRLNVHQALLQSRSSAWAYLRNSSITVPGSGSASAQLSLGGSGLPMGEYRASVKITSSASGLSALEQWIPVLLTMHNYSGLPEEGAQAVEFSDMDIRDVYVSGAVTITRASMDAEEEISQYRLYWGNADNEPLPGVAMIAALDSGSTFRDDMTHFDPVFWRTSNGVGWEYGGGALTFAGAFEVAHLTYTRQLAAPFTLKARVKKSEALAGLVIQIGGPSSVQLFRSGGGIQVAFVGQHKMLMLPDGTRQASVCSTRRWFEVVLTVGTDSVTFSDDQGCTSLTADVSLEGPQQIVIGSDTAGDSAGSMWDFFEVSGGAFATYTLPRGTLKPADAENLLVYSWNTHGRQAEPASCPLVDVFIPSRAEAPFDVLGASPTETTIMLSWSRALMGDCVFSSWSVLAMAGGATEWVAPVGCTGLVGLEQTTCGAQSLVSNTPYQFKVKIICESDQMNSLTSEPSLSVLTLPLSAEASIVGAQVPTDSTVLVDWESGALNDCDFQESLVENRVVNSTSWSSTAGCTVLHSINSNSCTATSLTSETEYEFRVKTICSNVAANSPPSAASDPITTTASISSFSFRRVLTAKMEVGVDYDLIRSNPTLRQLLEQQTAAVYAARLGVQPDEVRVSLTRSNTALSSQGRRLQSNIRATSFKVWVPVSDEASLEAGTSALRAGGGSTLASEVGAALSSGLDTAPQVVVPEDAVTSTKGAIAPQSVTASVVQAQAGTVSLTWSLQPLNDCAFLAFDVRSDWVRPDGVKISGLTPYGCTAITDFKSASCMANSLADGTYDFTVGVLCSNNDANSARSIAGTAVVGETPAPTPAPTRVPATPIPTRIITPTPTLTPTLGPTVGSTVGSTPEQTPEPTPEATPTSAQKETSAPTPSDQAVGVAVWTPPTPAPAGSSSTNNVVFKASLKISGVADFNQGAFLASVAQSSGVDMTNVKIASTEYKVAVEYSITGDDVSFTIPQAKQAVATSTGVAASAITVDVTLSRRTDALSSGRRLSGVKLSAELASADPAVAQGFMTSSTDVAALGTSLSEITGQTISVEVSKAPEMSVAVETTISTEAGGSISAPSAGDLSSSMATNMPSVKLGALDVIAATPAPTGVDALAGSGNAAAHGLDMAMNEDVDIPSGAASSRTTTSLTVGRSGARLLGSVLFACFLLLS
jgi:hypothetical protein